MNWTKWARQLDEFYDKEVDGDARLFVARELIREGNPATAAVVLTGKPYWECLAEAEEVKAWRDLTQEDFEARAVSRFPATRPAG